MNVFTLEIIAEAIDYGGIKTLSLPTCIHVHKRAEQFIYVNKVRDAAVPIAYLSNPQPDSWKNLVIVNRSNTVPANSSRLLAREKKIASVVATAYTSAYGFILATDRTITDSSGKEKPLFYKHRLPAGCTEATVTQVKNGNRELVEEGYFIDLEAEAIFTNYVNSFDADSGSYQLYFVSASAADGTVQNTLLNSEPAVQEATWEDLDLSTGELTDKYPLYSKERSGSGWTYSFNRGTRWFIKPLEIGLLQPRRPQNKRPDSPWYLRITNGDVSGVANNMVHRYRVPEFNTQPFIPFNPIKFGTKEDLVIVNRRVLASTRSTLSIDPNQGLHLEIHVEDQEGNLIKIYTTDQALSGVRYSNTDVFFESDKIASYDNQNGFIALATEIFPNNNYWAKFYYVADDYEYTLVNLNPITNKRMKDHTYVFYCVPDVGDADRAIHYLLVGPDGRIKDTSQNLGLTHPNLKLKNADSTFNANTVVGMLYMSDIEDSFLARFGASYANTNAYLILAEVSAVDVSMLEDQLVVDVRRPGGVIKPDMFAAVIAKNPRILQSYLGYGPKGQVVPEVNVMVLEPPLSLLEDYGGQLTQDQAEQSLKVHMPVSGHAVIHWVYPKTSVAATSFIVSQVAITMTWEGEFTYRLYRREALSDQWVVLHNEVNPAFGEITYADITALSDRVYQYACSILDGDIEYPMSDIVTIKVN